MRSLGNRSRGSSKEDPRDSPEGELGDVAQLTDDDLDPLYKCKGCLSNGYDDAMYCHGCGDSFHADCIRSHLYSGCMVEMGPDKVGDTLYNEAILARWGNQQPHFHSMHAHALMEAYQITHMHRIDEPLVQCAGCFRMMPIQFARRCHRCWRLFHVICVRRHAMEGCAGSAVRLYDPVKESTYKYSLVMSTAIMLSLIHI